MKEDKQVYTSRYMKEHLKEVLDEAMVNGVHIRRGKDEFEMNLVGNGVHKGDKLSDKEDVGVHEEEIIEVENGRKFIAVRDMKGFGEYGCGCKKEVESRALCSKHGRY